MWLWQLYADYYDNSQETDTPIHTLFRFMLPNCAWLNQRGIGMFWEKQLYFGYCRFGSRENDNLAKSAGKENFKILHLRCREQNCFLMSKGALDNILKFLFGWISFENATANLQIQKRRIQKFLLKMKKSSFFGKHS